MTCPLDETEIKLETEIKSMHLTKKSISKIKPEPMTNMGTYQNKKNAWV
jgi:hypothetical protein